MNKKKQQFVATVWRFYEEKGRHDLPWRQTHDPYCILVSEIMLQQTQVERVIPKFEAFLERWPTVEVLARASLAEVLVAWQGLGYNRRARMLHECAKRVVDDYEGMFPKDYQALLSLPGVGPYTAAAIFAFAFNIALPLIETNIRTVYFNHFYSNAEQVSDKDILTLVERTLDKENPRAWYYALMDYGSFLKKQGKGSLAKSRHYKKQSAFKGSDREIRGAIIRTLGLAPASKKALYTSLEMFAAERIADQLQALERELLVERHQKTYQLPT